MKIILTFFVLLFSSSVFADDLTGKKLICIIDASKVYNMTFSFTGPEEVNSYFSEQDSTIYSYNNQLYIALPTKINILFSDATYSIDRKTLKLNASEPGKKEVFESGTCELFNLNEDQLLLYLKTLVNQQIVVLKVGNKI